jgi:hypothetical protein
MFPDPMLAARHTPDRPSRPSRCAPAQRARAAAASWTCGTSAWRTPTRLFYLCVPASFFHTSVRRRSTIAILIVFAVQLMATAELSLSLRHKKAEPGGQFNHAHNLPPRVHNPRSRMALGRPHVVLSIRARATDAFVIACLFLIALCLSLIPEFSQGLSGIEDGFNADQNKTDSGSHLVYSTRQVHVQFG